MKSHDYPILEFDPASKAIIEPEEQVAALDVPHHCVITFFREVLEKLHSEGWRAILPYRHLGRSGTGTRCP